MRAPPQSLVEIFRQLDVPDPEGWANSEFNEGIDQTGRATVLRTLAYLVVQFTSIEFLQQGRGLTDKAEEASRRLMQKNADWEAIRTLCMESCARVVDHFLKQSSGVLEVPANPAEVKWAIVRIEDDMVIGEIGGLSENWYEILDQAVTAGHGLLPAWGNRR